MAGSGWVEDEKNKKVIHAHIFGMLEQKRKMTGAKSLTIARKTGIKNPTSFLSPDAKGGRPFQKKEK